MDECIKWVGTPLPTLAEMKWNFLNLHLHTVVKNSEREKKVPPTLLMLHEPVWLEELNYLSLLFWSDCFLLKILKFCRVLFLKVSEVASEDHGGWNSAHPQRHPRGFWELHLHADQRPADPAHGLRQPHSDAYVSVCSLQSWVLIRHHIAPLFFMSSEFKHVMAQQLTVEPKGF